MTNSSGPQVLLIQLEFPSWQRARSWSFSANFGVRDALLANGVECFTIPAIADIPPTSAASWLFHIKKLCAGRRFDQAWVWLVHTPLDDSILDWLTTVAPVRVGILMESLRYDHEDYAVAPHLLNRPAVVQRQLHYLTHLLAPDECDAVELRVHQSTRALWWPGAVPERCVADDWTPPTHPCAVFQGAVYGRRKEWISHPALQGRMFFAPPQAYTPHQRLFDLLQQATLSMLQSGVEVTEGSLSEYVESLYRIRSAEFTEYMQGLVQWIAGVNLPSMAKFYGGRVFEGMAAGQPVISWDIPNRPRNRALFEPGKEILLYDRASPESLADEIARLWRDPELARDIAKNARAKIRRYHTAEVRMAQMLRWIETGGEPDYGEHRSPGITESTAALAAAQSGSSPSHTVVHGTESAQSAPTSVEAATQSGAFCIKPDYTARSRPEYFLDQLSGVICQPDVYPIAAFLGHQLGCSHIIDIGCGNAEKLVALYPQFQIIGIDYGPNLQLCRRNYPFGQWVELNLETDSTIPIDPAVLRRSIIVCADVIEHLIKPTKLLHTIGSLMDHAPVAILTTPERDLTHGAAHLGPPPNPCHVREWNLKELDELLRAEHLSLLCLGLTINNNLERAKKNSIVFIGNNHAAPTSSLLDAVDAAATRWLERPLESRVSIEPTERPLTSAPIGRWQASAAMGVGAPDSPRSARGNPKRQGRVAGSFSREAGVSGGGDGEEEVPGSREAADGLRLLYVVHGFPPQRLAGTELYTYTLAQELRSRGHAVCVLYPDYNGSSEEGTIIEERYEGLEVARIRVKPADLISQFNNERLLPSLRRYLGRLRPDLVHIQHLIGISAAAVQVLREQGLSSVMTVHDGWLICEQCHFLQPHGTYCKDGPETVDKCVQCLAGRYGLSCQSEQIPKLFYALALRQQCLKQTVESIDTLVVPSEFMRQMLGRHGVAHPRVVVSPLGLPTFATVPQTPRTDRLRFTVLGNICFTKGVDLAIRAFNRLDPEAARLDLYGRVQEATYFSRTMDSVSPGHQVHYHGPYTQADLPSILAGTDVVVIPSRSEHYPFTVREALHAGVPVIAPNVGAVPEILRDGEEGFLFEPGDHEDLARKLSIFLGEPQRVMTFRQRIRPVRTVKDDVDQLEGLYRDVVAGRDSGVVQPLATEAASSRAGVCSYLDRAEEYTAKGDWAGARDALQQALSQTPEDPALITAFGNVLLRLGDIEGARREFVKATVLHSDYAPAHADLAAVLLHLGRSVEAETSARRTLELDSTNVGALKVLARVCLDTERYQEAVQAYATILEHAPDDLETLILVGNCYVETGRFDQARAFYRKVLGFDPGNQIATENLAEVDRLSVAVSAKVDSGTVNDGRSEGRSSVSIVVVTYNSVTTIRACLDSVLGESRPATELIVVDNASTDGTSAILEDYRGRITVVQNRENLGFSAACNQGVRASWGNYVVLLNPDTVVTPGWLDRMIAHLGPDVGAVGPVSDYVAGLQKYQLYHSGPPTDRTIEAIAGRMAQANGGRAVGTRLLIGFCLMVPRTVLDEIGLLDEDLFLGNDDLDLSWRLRQKGYRLVIATDVFVHHEGQVSFGSEPGGKTARLVQESTDTLYAKLKAHYGEGNVPDPMELWGINWFRPTKTCEVRGAESDASTPHPAPRTSIIILTHNGLEHTKKCLASIEAHTPESHELIIVDNASSDGTLDDLRDYIATHHHVVVIANRTNQGFAAGNNQGLVLAQGECVLLLNNDTVVTAGWLGRMLNVFDRHPEVGIVGPVSNYVSGSQLIKDARYASPAEMQAFAARWAADHAGQSRPITRVVGFCLLARKAVIDRIGGLDERFGSGNFEDDDFCIRAAQVGFKARIADDVFIHHAGSQTFKAAGIDYRKSMERNWELFKVKWGIPADSSMERGYRLPLLRADESDLFIPLPDLQVNCIPKLDGRWWAERQEAESLMPLRQAAKGTRYGPYTVVIRVQNGHPQLLWPSLSLTLTADPPVGMIAVEADGALDGAAVDLPEGWGIMRTRGTDPTRLLNQVLQGNGVDPVVLLSTDLMLTEGWLERLREVLAADPTLAIVAPTSGQAPRPQRIRPRYEGMGKGLRRFARHRRHEGKGRIRYVDYLGGFCLVLNRRHCQSVGGLREDLDLAEALWDLFGRLRAAGYRLAVALDVYVHHEALSIEEGASYDDLAQAEAGVQEIFDGGLVAAAGT